MTTIDRYTAEEIASILGVKVETLYDHRWREQAGCPLFKQGVKI